MLHDLIGSPENEVKAFLDNVDNYIASNGKYFIHKDRSPRSSVSVKTDKYFLQELKDYVQTKNPKQGVFTGKSTYELLRPHAENKYILQIDIKNYYGSIRFRHVEPWINDSEKLNTHHDTINKIYFGQDGQLKRGLSASPALSELVGMDIDKIVYNLIHNTSEYKSKITYARYYDDIIASTNEGIDLLRALKEDMNNEICRNLGLQLNQSKTRLKHLNGCEVLGLRFHANELLVPKKFKNNLKAIINNYSKNEYDQNEFEDVYQQRSLALSIIGRARYIADNSPERVARKYFPLIKYYNKEVEYLEERLSELEYEREENAHMF